MTGVKPRQCSDCCAGSQQFDARTAGAEAVGDVDVPGMVAR